VKVEQDLDRMWWLPWAGGGGPPFLCLTICG
jgi:hypothetical protein